MMCQSDASGIATPAIAATETIAKAEYDSDMVAPPLTTDRRPPNAAKRESVDKTPDASKAIGEAATQAATSPTNETPESTDAQKEAGNYGKGRVDFHGTDVSVENPRGSVRSGTDIRTLHFQALWRRSIVHERSAVYYPEVES